MPSFNPFTSVTGRHACTLFEIRLESDFIVFRGNEHEAAGQYLKGQLVLCLREPLKVEDIHLRLTGNCRLAWIEGKQTPTGLHNQKVDRSFPIFKHNWPPFVGGSSSASHTLAPGNYEWPFELLLNGDTAESVEGLYQTGVTYALKATISRGKLAKNQHAYKRLRIIRTLEPAALEFNHAMSVENIWPNKIEYSVVIPQKAVVFGSTVPLEMRFTPLLKGLDLGDVTVKLIEVHEFHSENYAGPARSYKQERDVTTWTITVNRDDHWQDDIEESGQEGWTVNKELPLPNKLTKCVQDCSVHGIKIRHKLKLTVALKNPDGHISELRATLPVTIFISPNLPLDEDGNIVQQAPTANEESQTEGESVNMAPPGYGQHVLDQLYEDVDPSGIMTPAGTQSGISSPFYAQSRAGSHENLSQLANSGAVPPAALSSRLQHVSIDSAYRNVPGIPSAPGSGATTPFHHVPDSDVTTDSSHPASTDLSRQPSGEDHSTSGHSTPPEHLDFIDLSELSKVPSYTTATRTPLPRTPSYTGMLCLPDYQTALSLPNTPAPIHVNDPLATISEGTPTEGNTSPQARSRRSSGHQRNSSVGFSFLHQSHAGHHDMERRLRLIQQRGGT